jgi:Na+/melibiose symporter-like transporter
VVAFVAGSSISCGFLLPWSMLPDVIDEYMILTGSRKESIFYSFYVFFTKLGVGLAVAISTAFLE